MDWLPCDSIAVNRSNKISHFTFDHQIPALASGPFANGILAMGPPRAPQGFVLGRNRGVRARDE